MNEPSSAAPMTVGETIAAIRTIVRSAEVALMNPATTRHPATSLRLLVSAADKANDTHNSVIIGRTDMMISTLLSSAEGQRLVKHPGAQNPLIDLYNVAGELTIGVIKTTAPMVAPQRQSLQQAGPDTSFQPT